MTNIAEFIASPTEQGATILATFLIGVGATAGLLLVGCACRRRRASRLAGQKGMYTFGEEAGEHDPAADDD